MIQKIPIFRIIWICKNTNSWDSHIISFIHKRHLKKLCPIEPFKRRCCIIFATNNFTRISICLSVIYSSIFPIGIYFLGKCFSLCIFHYNRSINYIIGLYNSLTTSVNIVSCNIVNSHPLFSRTCSTLEARL